MALPEALQSRIAHLNQQLDEFIGETKKGKKKFLKIFHETCAFVREEAANQSPHIPELVEAAQQILDKGVDYAYGDSDMFDFMPSWAHDNAAGQPRVKDTNEILGRAFVTRELSRILKVPSREMDDIRWKDSMKRHPKSSPLARPRLKIPTLTPAAANPIAMSVYDARCEVQSDQICQPIKLRLSQGNACLALNGAGGWKNCSPFLGYYLLDEKKTVTKFQSPHFLEPGLAGVAAHMALDESRHLIFVGDDDRVKSYSWGAPSGGNYEREPLPTHTLDSDLVRGPITVLPNGTLVRAGKGQVAVWGIDSLETHGETGQDIVGEEDEDILEDTDRDNPEDIDLSTGSSPTSHIKFTDRPDLSVTMWEPLIQSPSTMLCHSEPYGCYMIDLEHEGRIAARYLGHGGKIADLSVSGGDPQVFLTACSDAFARLFDLRTPLPVLTLDACDQDEFCDTAVLAHPDGIPTVFTGTGKAEQIKMWDVRARAAVYELATGNNRVQSLAWDSNRNRLYAATECSYQDRLGYRHDYRRSRMRGGARNSDFDDEEDLAWPKRAWRDEDYFGYAFDAGNHRIYRYAFKEDPNISIVPEYGDARVNESSSSW